MSTHGPFVVAIEYDSAVWVFEREVEFKDPMARYAAVQREFGYSWVTQIRGAPALVIRGNVAGLAPSINMVIGQVNIQVRGNTAPFDETDVIRIAASISHSVP